MKVSVLLHNLNRGSCLETCLESVCRQDYRPIEIVLLDAGSTDNSANVIRAAERKCAQLGIEIKLVDCPMLGVAASRNLAATYATGELLCSIDNDAAFVAPDGISRTVQAFSRTDRLGAVSFRVLNGDSDRLDPFAWIFRRDARLWSDRPFQTFIFAGTGFCIRASAFRDAGGFWDHLRYSREEEEIGMSLVNLGWDIEYMPAVEIRHYADARGRDSLKERRRMELRNGLLVIWRRLPVAVALPLCAARIGTMLLKSLAGERRVPSHLLGAVREATKEWRTFHLERRPISMLATMQYARLHYSRARY